MFIAISLIAGLSCLAAVALIAIRLRRRRPSALPLERGRPVSVNYHFLRQCNYGCGFCFHTDKFADDGSGKKTSMLPLEDAKRGLLHLKLAGMRKINFSGGEPFLSDSSRRFLGSLCAYCKDDLRLESVSIVSNGSMIQDAWLAQYGKYVDIIAISCDSFDDDTNKNIGRFSKSRLSSSSPRETQFEIALRVAESCKRHGVQFKLNTVVTSFNKNEDMTPYLRRLPGLMRWKVFQCLSVEGENVDGDTRRDVENFLISDDEFAAYIARHRADVFIKSIIKPEDNAVMRNSYLILDEKMRFLDNRDSSKRPTQSILDVGVQAALDDAGFDEEGFIQRDGFYPETWTRESGGCASAPTDIEDLGRAFAGRQRVNV